MNCVTKGCARKTIDTDKRCWPCTNAIEEHTVGKPIGIEINNERLIKRNTTIVVDDRNESGIRIIVKEYWKNLDTGLIRETITRS